MPKTKRRSAPLTQLEKNKLRQTIYQSLSQIGEELNRVNFALCGPLGPDQTEALYRTSLLANRVGKLSSAMRKLYAPAIDPDQK